MEHNEGARIELKQADLIDWFLDALGFDSKSATGKYTPTKTSQLTRNKAGQAPEKSSSYSSVVGMLLYLPGHSRPMLPML